MLLKPRKLVFLRWATEEAAFIVAVTLHFEMEVSAVNVVDLQRVGCRLETGENSSYPFGCIIF